MSEHRTEEERTVWVEIESDPESGMSFRRKRRHPKSWDHARYVKVPASTLARWEAAASAWAIACEEMFKVLKEAGGRGW